MRAPRVTEAFRRAFVQLLGQNGGRADGGSGVCRENLEFTECTRREWRALIVHCSPAALAERLALGYPGVPIQGESPETKLKYLSRARKFPKKRGSVQSTAYTIYTF